MAQFSTEYSTEVHRTGQNNTEKHRTELKRAEQLEDVQNRTDHSSWHNSVLLFSTGYLANHPILQESNWTSVHQGTNLYCCNVQLCITLLIHGTTVHGKEQEV